MVNAAWKMLELSYGFIYTGKRYDQQANIPENFAPEWYTSDIGIACNLRLCGLKTRVVAEVNNIFNQQFEVVKCYPMPGANFRASFSVDF